MTVNLKLFHLGNDVVRLRQKIDSEFSPHDEISMDSIRETFIDIVRLVNEIRLAIQDQTIAENNPKSSWKIEFACTTQELLAIREQMEVLELSYELRPKDQK